MRCKDINGPSPRFPRCIGEDDNEVRLGDPPSTPPVEKKPVVLKIKRRGDVTELGTQLIVEGGINQGIEKSWRIDVVDAKDHPLTGGRGSFVRLEANEIEIVTRLSPERVDKYAKGVLLTPPTP